MKEIYFSNFKESGKLKNAVSIARTSPKSFTGKILKQLSPTMAMIQRFKKNNDGQWQWFLDEYTRLLYRRIDLEQLYNSCKGKVLLCHCGKDELCHRIILAKTFEIEFGAVCKEVGGWSIPFNKSFDEVKQFMSIYINYNGTEIDAIGNYKKLADAKAKQ